MISQIPPPMPPRTSDKLLIPGISDHSVLVDSEIHDERDIRSRVESFRSTVECQFVGIRRIIEQRAIDSAVRMAPASTAEHAELGTTPAPHVVAASFQLDHNAAAVASLKVIPLLRHLKDLLDVCIIGAIGGAMPPEIAFLADLGSTFAASSFSSSY
jgi:hypothetical protein